MSISSKEFAVNATKEEGEFYTPHDVVQLIATMIEPFDGTLMTPAAVLAVCLSRVPILSGKSAAISEGSMSTVRKKEAATYRLAKMNLALRGISHNLGEESDSTFYARSVQRSLLRLHHGQSALQSEKAGTTRI